MAYKVQCDLCKETIDYNKTYFVKIYKRTSVDKGDYNSGLDICNECLKKLKSKMDAKSKI